jgi:TM2 domain-containing membrane protein YozV
MNCSNPDCLRANDEQARFCRFCGTNLFPRVEPPGPFPVGKSPGVALFFAIVPSLGQFYNGDFKKGVLIAILAAACWAMAVGTAGGSLILFCGVWLWGAVNAYNVAARKTPLWA